jgi:hypothetical protein
MTAMQPFEESFNPITPDASKVSWSVGVVTTRVDVLRRLTDELSLNELGLPNYIYRSDLIPQTLFDPDVTEEERLNILQSASFDLDYSEGYPCQQDGTPLWSQLAFEPTNAYTVFLEYLGATRREDEEGRLVSPVRTFFNTSKVLAIPEAKLRDLSYLYYWPARAKAYDLFMIANFQKQRETRALFVEDDHFLKARRWMKKAEARLEDIFADDDLLFDMKPKEVFNMFKELMVLQRISAGLPANGPAEGYQGVQGAGLQRAIQTIAKQVGEESRVQDSQKRSIADMLDDPESIAALQDLIIKANSKG